MTDKQFINFLKRVCPTPTCWLWEGTINSDGYGSFRLGDRTVKVHRLSYELCYGPIPNSLYIMHKCDNPRCVNPEHLAAGTQKQNMQDAVAKKRIAFGERVGCAKLTDQEGREIRDLAKSGLFEQKVIASWYKVAPSTVANIKRGYRRSMT